MSSLEYKVTGDFFDFSTYPVQAEINRAGGKWDVASKSWIVTLSKSDSLWRYEGQVKFTPIAVTDAQKEKDYDALHNEGGEGFDPYR